MKQKYTSDELDARLKFFLGLTLGTILLFTTMGILYALVFVTQPIGAQSENDKMFFNVLKPIVNLFLLEGKLCIIWNCNVLMVLVLIFERLIMGGNRHGMNLRRSIQSVTIKSWLSVWPHGSMRHYSVWNLHELPKMVILVKRVLQLCWHLIVWQKTCLVRFTQA